MRVCRICSSLVLTLLLFILSSCSTSRPGGDRPLNADGRYDSEFPSQNVSGYLERIAESVKMISTIAYYRTYDFPEEKEIRLSDLTPTFFEEHEGDVTYVTRSMSGTATAIHYADKHIALLTCAHVVAFPETVITYFIGRDRRATEFIKGVAIREKQTNYVGLLPEGGEVEILCIDKGSDLAIVGRRFDVEPPISPAVFPYPLGDSGELGWGTFLYLFGYPSGQRIVTRGIVSNPNKDKRAGFLVDAVFGGGFSGGIAIALRDGPPHFELVGVMKIASARSFFIVTPPRDDSGAEYDPSVPYRGDIYVERHTDIEYGVTQAISTESILNLLATHRDQLQSRGYRIALRSVNQ